MFKGFYNLTSGVLTHQRNLNVIANNMVNVSTPGFKQERYTATTFDEVMYSRVGNKDSQGPEVGEQSYIRATSEVYTDFTQGTLEPTDKCRGAEKSLSAILKRLKESGLKSGKVILAHCKNEPAAITLKNMIEAELPDVTVRITVNLGLCSYYAEEGGLLVGFERG